MSVLPPRRTADRSIFRPTGALRSANVTRQQSCQIMSIPTHIMSAKRICLIIYICIHSSIYYFSTFMLFAVFSCNLLILIYIL